jgi:nucleotide-binding universal stress UspA family protein
MTYKTILVHLNRESRARALLDTASQLVERFNAHLVGLHVFPANRTMPPVPLPLVGEVAAQIRGAIKKEDEAIKAVFDEMTAGRPFTSEWRSIVNERRDPAQVVLGQAHAAELIVTSQADPNWQLSDLLDFPDRLTIGAGRPVLVVPNFGRHAGVPRNVLVAWTNSRESARAIGDAMPILKLASRVHLMTILEAGASGEDGSLADAAAALRRHGIDPVVSRPLGTEFTTGEELRVRAIDDAAELLVMGCYGHSRMREMALGGVTRHLLREATIPLLLSH